jgi:hypothetical protein
MTFQSVVNVDLNLGVPGDIVIDEPNRTQPVTLAAAAAIGLFLTVANNTGLASPGGALAAGSVVYGGVAVLPKIEPLFGSSAANPLNPNLNVQANEQVAMLTFGSCVLNIPNAWNVGDFLQYNLATGVISTYSPSGAPSGGNAQIPGAQMTRFGNANAGGGLGIARFNAPN